MFAKAVKKLEHISAGYNSGLAAFASILTVFLVLITVWDVGGRFLFNSPLKGSIEISQTLLPFVVWSGFAYALVVGSHVRVTILLGRLHGGLRFALEIMADALGIFLFGILLSEGWELFWSSWRVNELMPAAVYLPYWVSKFIVPVMIFIMMVQFLIRLLVHCADPTALIQQEPR